MKTLPILLLLAMTGVAAADVIILNDDTRLEGVAHKSGDDWVIVDAAGKEHDVPIGQVKSFELKRGPAAGADGAADRLTSLKRSIQNVSNIHEIIDRYQTFIDANKGAPAVDEAKNELEIWQDRLAKGYVKAGSKWIAPEDADLIGAIEAANAKKIADMLDQGRTQDAADALKQAVADDPQDPCTLYIEGVMLTLQNQFVAARKVFDQVNAQIPNNAPTLTNIATMMWRQRLYGAAIAELDQAMLASPENQMVLDDVAEALNDVPDETKGAFVVKKAAAHFAEQDAALAKTQEAKGLYRWGATWVTAKQLEELKADETANNEKLVPINTDCTSTEAAIKEAEASIQKTNQQMQMWDAMTHGSLTNGTTYQPVPPQYTQLQQDLAGFTAAKKADEAHLKELHDQAKKVREDLPILKFTGSFKMFGVISAPVRSGKPTTQPTTGPA